VKAHNALYWYEISVLHELAKQQYIYFGFEHTTNCIQQLTIKVNRMDIEIIQSYLVNVVNPDIEKDQKRYTCLTGIYSSPSPFSLSFFHNLYYKFQYKFF
jgi:hypothetical protein